MSTNNLLAEQRVLRRRARRLLAMLPDPERRVLVATLREMTQLTMAPLLADIQKLQIAIEHLTAEDDAVRLALEERLGHEPEDGEPITPLDEWRAQEILAMYPKAGGE
jgi:hypothetical protein